jgi:hypothetical protein
MAVEIFSARIFSEIRRTRLSEAEGGAIRTLVEFRR